MPSVLLFHTSAPVSHRGRSNATLLSDNGGRTQQLTFDVFSEDDDSENSSSSRIPDQKVRIELAVRYVHEHCSILNREYRNLTGVSEHTALRDLEMLVEQGILKKVGKTRLRRYELS